MFRFLLLLAMVGSILYYFMGYVPAEEAERLYQLRDSVTLNPTVPEVVVLGSVVVDGMNVSTFYVKLSDNICNTTKDASMVKGAISCRPADAETHLQVLRITGN